MARCIQAFKFYRFADFDDVASLHATRHARNLAAGLVVRDDLSTGGRCHRCIAAGMVMVFVGIENLGNLPAFDLGRIQGFFMIQRINSQRFSGLWANDQVIEIAIGIARPDAFDDHVIPLGFDASARYLARAGLLESSL